MTEPITTRDLIAQYAVLLNKFGADSDEAANFVEQHIDDSEFVDLAELSRTLKKALTSANCLQSHRPSYST